jgi:hypothetical protein
MMFWVATIALLSPLVTAFMFHTMNACRITLHQVSTDSRVLTKMSESAVQIGRYLSQEDIHTQLDQIVFHKKAPTNFV